MTEYGSRCQRLPALQTAEVSAVQFMEISDIDKRRILSRGAGLFKESALSGFLCGSVVLTGFPYGVSHVNWLFIQRKSQVLQTSLISI